MDPKGDLVTVLSPEGRPVSESFRRSPPCSPTAWRSLLRRLMTDADVAEARALYRGPNPAQDPVLSEPNPPFLSPLGWTAIVMVGAVIVLGLGALLRR